MPKDRNRDDDRRGTPRDHQTAVWLEAARAGDAESLGRALEDCRHDLRRAADADIGAGLAAKVGASDLVQETFLAAQRDFAGFRGSDEAAFRAWLRTILHRRLSDAVRRFRGRREPRLVREVSLDADSGRAAQARERADTTTSPSGRAVRVEEREAIWAELDRLPRRYRDAIVWRYWERWEFEAIGDRLGVSADAARKLCERALTKLNRAIRATHESR